MIEQELKSNGRLDDLLSEWAMHQSLSVLEKERIQRESLRADRAATEPMAVRWWQACFSRNSFQPALLNLMGHLATTTVKVKPG